MLKSFLLASLVIICVTFLSAGSTAYNPYPPELYGIPGFKIPPVPKGCDCPPPQPEICSYTYRPVAADLFNQYCQAVHDYIKCPVYYCSQPNPALVK